MNMKNKVVYLFIISLFISLSIIAAYILIPNPGHGADQIIVNTGTGFLNFQQAISQGVLNGTISLSGSGNPYNLILGHYASEIWIKLNGKEQTLQDAINNASLCCNSCTPTLSYSTSLQSTGHYALNLTITNRSGGEKNLQKAIDDGDFCSSSTLTQTFYGLSGDVFVTTGDEWSPITSDTNYTEVFYADTHGGGGGNYYSHAFMFFDTSSLPDNVNILSAYLEIYGINYTSAFGVNPTYPDYASFGTLDYQNNIYNKTNLEIYYNTSNSFYPIDPNMFSCCWDWDNRYATLLSDDSLSSWKINNYNNLNLPNPSFINKYGKTSFVLMINPQTFYNNVNKGYASILFYSADYSDITKRPKLVISYTT